MKKAEIIVDDQGRIYHMPSDMNPKEVELLFPSLSTPSSNIRCEFGSFGNVRFLQPENVKMYDSDGNIVLCKCGKPASSGIAGKESSIAWCADCSPMSQKSAEFVFQDPSLDNSLE